MSPHPELVEDALAALRAQGIAATVEYGRHIKVRFHERAGAAMRARYRILAE